MESFSCPEVLKVYILEKTFPSQESPSPSLLRLDTEIGLGQHLRWIAPPALPRALPP